VLQAFGIVRGGGRGNSEGAAAYSGLDCSLESITQTSGVHRKRWLGKASFEGLQNDRGLYPSSPGIRLSADVVSKAT